MIYQFFGPTEIRFVINLLLGLVAGFIIGAERELRGKPAGISTHTMVIVGAMLFTFISAEADPEATSRIAAQVVSGIGFLGAGLIIKEGSNIVNLTTAASLWVSGALGMAIGFDFHVIAIIMTLAITLIPRIPHVTRKSPER